MVLVLLPCGFAACCGGEKCLKPLHLSSQLLIDQEKWKRTQRRNARQYTRRIQFYKQCMYVLVCLCTSVSVCVCVWQRCTNCGDSNALLKYKRCGCFENGKYQASINVQLHLLLLWLQCTRRCRSCLAERVLYHTLPLALHHRQLQLCRRVRSSRSTAQTNTHTQTHIQMQAILCDFKLRQRFLNLLFYFFF